MLPEAAVRVLIKALEDLTLRDLIVVTGPGKETRLFMKDGTFYPKIIDLSSTLLIPGIGVKIRG